MRQSYIDVRTLTLSELFSGTYVFQLPWFQRAYAWQTDQVSLLLSDLFACLEREGDEAEYFLGTLLICKPNDAPTTILIDGHQRTMTLTILFSVLRDLCATSVEKAHIARFIKTSDFHLRPQNLQAEFCRTFVQSDGATQEQPDEIFEDLSFTERNILISRDFIRDRLSGPDITDETRSRLFKFLSDRCHVIVHQAPDEEEAWARLRKEEETRLDFSSADLAKDNILSMIPAAEREECAQLWEQAEALIGGEDLHGLLCHLSTLKKQKLRNKPLEEAIAESFQLNKNALSFMRQVFLPAAEHLRALRQGHVGPKADRPRVAELSRFMSWVDPQAWIPPALAWLRKYELEDPNTLSFFTSLERVFWLVKMSPDGTEKLPLRMAKIAAQIDKGTPIDKIDMLKIERGLKTKALEKLRAQYFDRRALRVELMRRIAVTVSDDPGSIDNEAVTVEHILPRGWKLQNKWRDAFPNKAAVISYAHRLGNLTYLTREQNADADSKDFETKKEIYANSGFEMTRALAGQKDWQQVDIDARTEALIAALFEEWGLSIK